MKLRKRFLIIGLLILLAASALFAQVNCPDDYCVYAPVVHKAIEPSRTPPPVPTVPTATPPPLP